MQGSRCRPPSTQFLPGTEPPANQRQIEVPQKAETSPGPQGAFRFFHRGVFRPCARAMTGRSMSEGAFREWKARRISRATGAAAAPPEPAPSRITATQPAGCLREHSRRTRPWIGTGWLCACPRRSRVARPMVWTVPVFPATSNPSTRARRAVPPWFTDRHRPVRITSQLLRCEQPLAFPGTFPGSQVGEDEAGRGGPWR